MNRRLENKVALIIGASKGIGRGIAKVFAQEGAKLLVVARNENALKSLVAELSGPNERVQFYVGDMGNEADMQNAAKKALDFYGKIDILCANAGIYPENWLGQMTLAQWNEVILTNLTGVFLATNACIPCMKEQNYGRIVITSSISGPKVGLPGFSHYTASKAGICGFIKTAAIELAKYNITVNAIEPGNIITESLIEMGAELIDSIKKDIPMGHLGTVEDIGYSTLFLASDEAKFITGQTLVVDGGQVLPQSNFLPYSFEDSR